LTTALLRFQPSIRDEYRLRRAACWQTNMVMPSTAIRRGARAATECWMQSRPGGIWRDSGRPGLASSGRSSSTAGYVRVWVTPRKYTPFIDKVNLEIVQIGRREDQSFPSPIVVGDRREKCPKKRVSYCTYSWQTAIFFVDANLRLFNLQFLRHSCLLSEFLRKSLGIGAVPCAELACLTPLTKFHHPALSKRLPPTYKMKFDCQNLSISAHLFRTTHGSA